MLVKAHEVMESDPDEALDLVNEAIELGKAQERQAAGAIGFDQFLKSVVDRLGVTPPDQWSDVDTELLLQDSTGLRRDALDPSTPRWTSVRARRGRRAVTIAELQLAARRSRDRLVPRSVER